MEPTPLGELLVAHAQLVISEITLAPEELAELRSGARNILRIAVGRVEVRQTQSDRSGNAAAASGYEAVLPSDLIVPSPSPPHRKYVGPTAFRSH